MSQALAASGVETDVGVRAWGATMHEAHVEARPGRHEVSLIVDV